MRKTTYTESAHTADTTQPPADASKSASGLPNRLMTAFEVAEFIGCHEETVRRAYLRGLLTSQRFGVRGRGSILQTSSTSSTGFVEDRQREFRNRKEDPCGCSKDLQTEKAVARARAAVTPGGST